MRIFVSFQVTPEKCVPVGVLSDFEPEDDLAEEVAGFDLATLARSAMAFDAGRTEDVLSPSTPRERVSPVGRFKCDGATPMGVVWKETPS